ncbi:L-arabinose transport system permease protein AraQ [compost metagenome]|uniref:Carbohydrate ABC transporter permease n=1 Tax=Paenibacillus rhizolycopersici TaxID=2780073 RepID=A0ABS2H516_9BACL|nr:MULTISPECIES: carbohydrate ABC transporter permease [Paenibacillus]MBM6995898.1 carbohydrate ABC transporter permease [Paenibacillus rhizolycopersici]GIP49277.1 putative ABC transporter permease protein AmyC [Paenibacillus sp. J53TS2]
MKTARRVVFSLICLIHLIPFYLLINLSFKPPEDTSSKWQPASTLYWDNFVNAWTRAHIDKAIMTNLTVTVFSVLLVILVGAFASYPLARNRTKWNSFIYSLCISCLVVPSLTILVPLYKFVVDIGGLNQYWSIILLQVTFALPLTIFLLTGFMGNVPKELDEAALIDGCSRYSIFFRIILPLLKPIVATIIIVVGVQIWNDYQFSVFFLQKSGRQTIPVALSMFISQHQSNINWVAAGCLMGMMPLTVVYLFLQKYFIKGMADGAVKG